MMNITGTFNVFIYGYHILFRRLRYENFKIYLIDENEETSTINCRAFSIYDLDHELDKE